MHYFIHPLIYSLVILTQYILFDQSFIHLLYPLVILT